MHINISQAFFNNENKMTKGKKKYKKEKKQKARKKGEMGEYMIEVSQMKSDVKTFIKKFRADVAKKRKAYQSGIRPRKKEK